MHHVVYDDIGWYPDSVFVYRTTPVGSVKDTRVSLGSVTKTTESSTNRRAYNALTNQTVNLILILTLIRIVY